MEADEGDGAVWLGTALEEYPTLEDLVAAAKAQGCEIGDIGQDTILAMLEEAGQPRLPNWGERYGLLF